MVVLRRTEKFETIFSPTPFEFQQRTQPIQVSKKSPYLVSTASWPQKLNINFFPRWRVWVSSHPATLLLPTTNYPNPNCISRLVQKWITFAFPRIVVCSLWRLFFEIFTEILVWLECNRNLDSGVWLPEVLSPCYVCFSQYQSCGLVINIIYPPSSLRDLPSQVMFP